MATRSGIDTAITSRLTDDHQIMGVAVKAEFDTADIRVWSGLGDATISSETYTGAGTFKHRNYCNFVRYGFNCIKLLSK